MRDPYDVLGVSRGAAFDEVKAAYRRACKTRHPDMGGSPEAFVELQAAYETILANLKRGFERQKQEAPPQPPPERERKEKAWDQAYRDIDDELEELRRSARQREDALREMRAQAWQDGDKAAWAKLTWKDLAGFLSGLLRGGAKGLSVLVAALVGVGAVLVEANAVSAVIMLGAGFGFVFSHALKSDKGGMLSAGLLLFGIMTIWLPPVRHALIHYPLATVSLLLCLALVFKFGQQGGIVGLLTFGVLTLYVAAAIIAQSETRQEERPIPDPVEPVPPVRPPETPRSPIERPRQAPEAPRPAPEAPRPVPETRTLVASKGALLKLVPGVAYRLQIRGGRTTSIEAIRGRAAPYRGEERAGECTARLDLYAPPGTAPYATVETTYRACDGEALFQVSGVQ